MGAALNIKHISLDKQLLDEVVASVRKVFKEGFSIDVELQSSLIGKNQIATGDISGVVGLVQNQFEGNLILSFTQSTILDILQRIYGPSLCAIDSICEQGTAELANMIYGHVKQKLNLRGHELKMALPNVVVGEGHHIYSRHDSVSLGANFSYGKNNFKIFITLQED